VLDRVNAIGRARTFIPPVIITPNRDIATRRRDDRPRIERSDQARPGGVREPHWSVIDPTVAPAAVRVRLNRLDAILDELDAL
jgi:hypothetical protein